MLLLLALDPAAVRGAAPAPRVTGTDAGSAVAGAAVTLRGRSLGGKGVTVTVTGRRARLLARTARALTFVVPSVRPGATSVVVRTGKRTASIRLRVLRPFKGKISAALDSRRAARRTVGPAGGTVAARGTDGTAFSLAIPPGALTRETVISVVPVARFRGVPFTGGRIEGARLLPDGLVLSVPATLTISGGRRFGSRTVGFAFARSLFETTAARVGAATVLEIGHFSDHGAAEASAADFANLIQPILDGGNLSRAEVTSLLSLVALWDQRFSDPDQVCDGLSLKCVPPSFCKLQPLCLRAYAKARTSIEALIDGACRRGRQATSLAVMRELSGLGIDRSLLAGDGDPSIACIEAVGRAMTDEALAALAAAPLAPSSRADQLPRADRDGDGRLTTFEYALDLAVVMDEAGVPRAGADLTGALEAAFGRILTDGRARCETDRAGGARDLRTGLGYANARSRSPEAFVAALAACGVELFVSPASVELAPREQQQFAATLTSVEAREAGLEGVTWSATGGTITPQGLFTAPAAPGVVEVRATSTLNAARSATARVAVVEAASICAAPAVPASRARAGAARTEAPPVVQPGDVVLRTREEIEAFRAAGITEVTGSVRIGNPDASPTALVDVAGLERLTTVGGQLEILGNPQLRDLSGLAGIRSSAGLTLFRNTALRDLRGLEGLSPQVGGSLAIQNNAALENVDGLCGLASGFNFLVVLDNPALRSLGGLSGVTAVGELIVERNDALAGLEGLDGIAVITSQARVGGRALVSMGGLRNLRTIGTSLQIASDGGGDAASTYTFAGLERIGGMVSISGDGGQLRTVAFPALTELGFSPDRGFDLRNTDVTSVQAPLLPEFGELYVEGTDEALSFQFRPDVRVRGLVTIRGGRAGGSVALSLGRAGSDVRITCNQRSAINIDVGVVVLDLEVQNNFNTSPLNSQFGLVSRGLTITNNVGFTNAQAQAYADTIPGPTGLNRKISGNTQDGTPLC